MVQYLRGTVSDGRSSITFAAPAAGAASLIRASAFSWAFRNSSSSCWSAFLGSLGEPLGEDDFSPLRDLRICVRPSSSFEGDGALDREEALAPMV